MGRQNPSQRAVKTMKFLNTAELQAVLPSVWGIDGDDDIHLVRDLARRYPGMMRRIHDIASLTLASGYGLPGWLDQPVGGVVPIALLRAGEDGLRRLDAIMVERFRAVAPREVFDIPGAATDVGGEGEFIVRLLQEREGSVPGGSGEIHDPMRFDRHRITDAGKRLALADRPVSAVRRYADRAQDGVCRGARRRCGYPARRDCGVGLAAGLLGGA